MAQDVRGQPVVVELAECRCPGTPHHHDTVELAPRLTLPAGAATLQAMKAAEADEAAIEAALTRVFLRFGIVAWSCLDEAGEAVPIDYATIDARLDWATARAVAERANELYAADFFRPLVAAMSRSSPPSPMAGSTSATNGSGSRRPKRSKRSSPPATGSKPSAAQAP